MVVLLLHHHFFCFPVWMSGAMVFCHLPKTASWKGLPADLAVFFLPNPLSDHRSPLHSLRLLCFVSSPQRHLAVTSCPRASLVGTLHGSRVYILASQIPPHFSVCHALPSKNFVCFSFKSLLPSCFSLVYISIENKDPRTLPQRIS